MIREGGGWGGGEEGYRGEERSEGIIVQYRNYHLVSSTFPLSMSSYISSSTLEM